MHITIPYKPRQLAQQVHSCTARFITLVAHRRFGKSVLLFNHLQREALKKRGRYAIVGPYSEQVRSIYWTGGIINTYTPHQVARVTQQPLQIVYSNGSILEFIGSENYDAKRGAQYDYLALDECDDHRPEAWASVFRYTILGQADGTFTGGRVIFAGTIKGQGFLWNMMQLEGANRASFLFRASETGLLTDEDMAEVRAECGGNEALMMQELECVPMYYSGLIYREFGEHNKIAPFEVPSNWAWGFALDHGINNPTAFLVFRVDFEGNIYVVGEHYKAGSIISEHAPIIMEHLRRAEAEGGSTSIVADPSVFNNALQGGHKTHAYSVADEYMEHGILGLSPGQNDVIAGINRVKEYLRLDPERINPITQNKGAPRLFIFNGACPALEKELGTYRWKEKKGNLNDPDEPVKSGDHALDALRYFVMDRPSPAQEEQKKHDTKEERLRREMLGLDDPEEEEYIYI